MRRSRFEAVLATTLWLTGALAVMRACWLATAQGSLDWRHAVLVVCVAASGWVALQGWRRTPPGVLHWDGGRWCWADRTGLVPGAAAVRLDLQRLVLVRWQPQQGTVHWVWLEAVGAGGRWHDVRCALRATTQVDPAVSVPAAHG